MEDFEEPNEQEEDFENVEWIDKMIHKMMTDVRFSEIIDLSKFYSGYIHY